MGMNPGPWGMAQTGVPFGEVAAVRDWLGIEATVGRPPARAPEAAGARASPAARGEVSAARRLWGWAAGALRRRRGPSSQRFFVANYCPLLLLDAGGRNLTPDRLPTVAGRPLLEVCDLALRRTVLELRPRWWSGWARSRRAGREAAMAGYRSG